MSAEVSLAERYNPIIEADGERARRELRDLVAGRPGSVEALWLLAVACLRCLDFEGAAETARRILALAPDHHDALHMLGQCLIGLGDAAGALEAYRRTFEVTRTVRAAARVSLLSHRLGRLDEARDWGELVLSRGAPDSIEAAWTLRNMVRLRRDRGEPLIADRHADAYLRRFERDPFLVASGTLDLDQSTGFHEWYGLAEKGRLAALVRRGLEADPSARVPESFTLPAEREELARFAAHAPAGTLYIVKPVRGSGGQGIQVIGDAAEALDRAEVVVQRYIADPLLIDGRKGHARVYALIASAEPLRAYVYSEGVVRFAPEPYDPRPDRLADVAMHVTNTALHKGHPGLVVSQDSKAEDQGAIWTLSAMLRRMRAEGRDAERTFGEIGELVAWFVRCLSAEGLIGRQAASGPARAFAPKLIGFDILIDAEGHPWLLEIQAKPAAEGSPLVHRVNGELYSNLVRMTVGCAFDDAMAPERLAATRADPTALAEREREIEIANLGRFAPLDL